MLNQGSLVTKKHVHRLLLLFIFFLMGDVAEVFAAISDVSGGSSIGVASQQFALESSNSIRFDLAGEWKSSSVVDAASGIPARELHIYSFFEGGDLGDKSIDIDRTALRFSLSKPEPVQYVWVGRSHPASEGAAAFLWPTSVSAVGANWVQNQSDVFEPRTSGWIGLGWFGKAPVGNSLSIIASVSMSPVFLPSFGPRLDLHDSNIASGSRYARLPPTYLNWSSELTIPIHYHVNTGDLKKIVFQNQYFGSLGCQVGQNTLRFMSWSAPSPVPQISIDKSVLAIDVEKQSDPLSIAVFATPRFPRENFVAMQMGLGEIWPSPVVEAAHESSSGRLALSAKAEIFKFLSVGALHTFFREQPAPPVYANKLVWLDLGYSNVRSSIRPSIRPSIRVERHLASQVEGALIRPSLEYSVDQKMLVFASSNLIVGTDKSYFGAWREFDSFSVGARYVW